MAADGDLQQIEHQTLPPRKRAGWTGGDDRGPSSKPKDKSGQNPQGGEDAAVCATDCGIAVGSEIVGAESTSTGAVKLAVALGAKSTTSVEGADALEDAQTGGDGVLVEGENRREGMVNTQAEDHPAEIASNGGELAGKREDELKGGEGNVDIVEGKQKASDAGLDVDAKRSKTLDGDDVA